MKEKTAIKSSKMLSEFLEKNNLHKKDFAQMIGVTLSYVYNLIDNTIPFSTRSTTLERIATVMEVEPETFEEYRLPQEPILIDNSVEKIKDTLNTKKIKIIDFLKAFPRNKRLDIVDILRGALPIPLDYQELNMIGENLGLSKEEQFEIWEDRFKSVLDLNGMNIYSNSELVNTLTSCAKKYILKK
jgi:transcriptional regulator with XRE-family HTH domain